MHVIIEIAMSMVGLYIIFSIVNSALVEAYAQYSNKRGKHLKKSLDNFFQDPNDASINLANNLYDHKLIKAFMKDNKTKPSYIDKKIFSQAFMELVFEDTNNTEAAFKGTLISEVENKLPEELKSTMQFLLNKSKSGDGVDMEKMQGEIESLYDSYMVRVSEWYKNKSKVFLMVSGLALAMLLNLDSINFFNALQSDGELRREQVNIAKALNENRESIMAKATTLQDSIEISNFDKANVQRGVNELIDEILDEDNARTLKDNFTDLKIGIHQFDEGKNSIGDYLWGLLGVGLTGIALSLGSSFWFGLLKKLVSK